MKTYEKPRLMFLSLNGNDQLCGTCAKKNGQLLYQDPSGYPANAFDMLFSTQGKGNYDGTLTREEANQLFGNDEDCEVGVDNYCKFNAGDQGNKVIAWS